MRTWLHDFWIPYSESRHAELRVIHTATRPTQAPGAYRPLPQTGSFRVIPIRGSRVPGSGANLPRAADLAQAIAGSDVLYFDNGYVLQDVVALKAARTAGVRIISGHHSVILHAGTGLSAALHNASWNLLGKRMLARFDAVHALNSTDEAYLRRAGGKNVCAIPLPIDLRTFNPGAKRSRFTVLFVGRLHAQKGIDRLQKIAQALLESDSGIDVRIVGAGPQEELVSALARNAHVTTLSRLERPQVAAEMRAAHVLVAPSRSETFGFVAAEALASGTPVLCTPTNGFVDLVNEGNGAIVQDADIPAAWLAAVRRIRTLSGDEYAGLCERARASVEWLGFDVVAAGMDELLAKR
jgi:glycosyltransferase involved in cell wall biosynthesis